MATGKAGDVYLELGIKLLRDTRTDRFFRVSQLNGIVFSPSITEFQFCLCGDEISDLLINTSFLQRIHMISSKPRRLWPDQNLIYYDPRSGYLYRQELHDKQPKHLSKSSPLPKELTTRSPARLLRFANKVLTGRPSRSDHSLWGRGKVAKDIK